MDNYDFGGWATRNDLKCSDGRTIKKDAFVDNDNQTVPLVWNHDHSDPRNVLGHALLKNMDFGVYAYCTINDTEAGQDAKKLVEHGDINSLSIYANKLKEKNKDVFHGMIREVSLVLAGANPGAYIDTVLEHSDDSDEEAVIFTGEEIDIAHSEESVEKEKEMDKKKCGTKETKEVEGDGEVETVVKTSEKKPEETKEDSKDDSKETVQDIVDSMTEKQKKVLYSLVGEAASKNKEKPDSATNNIEENNGGKEMKHNLFNQDEAKEEDNVLCHDAMKTIIKDAKRCGTLGESVLQHADEYGITNIEYLFPDAKSIEAAPGFVKRQMGWVDKVFNGVHHTPFSRIKSVFADITEDDARAKGYIKGKLKKEEIFSLLKRTTSPTTIYKKQKMDRDDVVDIKDFDVVSWLKTEMRMMLNEEIARAVLVGDGRLASSDDKINEENIRPIWKDADLYSVKCAVSAAATDTESVKAVAFIESVIRGMEDYEGAGDPTLYAPTGIVTDCLLLKNTLGEFLYKSVAELATTLGVKEIVKVPVMKNLSRTDNDGNKFDLMGIIVNLSDYNIGADKGGEVNMFDDFDIDYNQQKYLIETRCSGALVVPKSALVMEIKTAKA